MTSTCATMLRATTSAIALAMAVALPVHAQDNGRAVASDTRLDEIVVTARKVEENLDTIPLAITALTSKSIEARNIKSMEDLSGFTPGFFMNANTTTGQGRNDRSFRQLTFRGIGANSTNTRGFAGGLAFLDGAPVLNSSLANIQDVARVEVLKGPQSAYFGRSTFLGAVSYISKDPTNEWQNRLTAEFSEDGSTDDSVAFSGPIIKDKLLFRLSGRHFEKRGQYKTSNSGVRLGDQGTDAISLTLLATPIESLRLRAYANYFVDEDGPPAQYTIGGRSIGPGGSNCNLGGRYGAYYCGQVPQKANPLFVSGNYELTPYIRTALLGNNSTVGLNVATGPQPFDIPFTYDGFLDHFGLKREAFQTSFRADYDFSNGMTITSNTAYHREKTLTLANTAFRDTSSIPAPVPNPEGAPSYGFYSASVGYEAWDVSSELRLVSDQTKRLRWLIGGNYVKLNHSTSGIISISRNAIQRGSAVRIGTELAETPAVFGGINYDLMSRLTLSLEGRYQSDKISLKSYVPAAAPLNNSQTAGVFRTLTRTFDSFSPRVSLDYKLTSTSTVYALFSRGYKPGGFNAFLITQPAFIVAQVAGSGVQTAYDQERLDNYEIGIKGSFYDGKARGSLTAYRGDYTDVQINVPTQYYLTETAIGSGVPNTAGAFSVTPLFLNAGTVDLQGIEAEGEIVLAPGVRVGATFSINDTKMTEFVAAEAYNFLADPTGSATGAGINNIAAIGKELPGAPKYTASASVNYDRPINDTVTLFAGGDWVWRSRYFVDYANLSHTGDQSSVNVRIGARTATFSVEAFVRNLFDDQSPGASYVASDTFFLTGGTGNSIRIALPDSRRFGIRGSYDF